MGAEEGDDAKAVEQQTDAEENGFGSCAVGDGDAEHRARSCELKKHVEALRCGGTLHKIDELRKPPA